MVEIGERGVPRRGTRPGTAPGPDGASSRCGELLTFLRGSVIAPFDGSVCGCCAGGTLMPTTRKSRRVAGFFVECLVGVTGFEPATSTSRT